MLASADLSVHNVTFNTSSRYETEGNRHVITGTITFPQEGSWKYSIEFASGLTDITLPDNHVTTVELISPTSLQKTVFRIGPVMHSGRSFMTSIITNTELAVETYYQHNPCPGSAVDRTQYSPYMTGVSCSGYPRIVIFSDGYWLDAFNANPKKYERITPGGICYRGYAFRVTKIPPESPQENIVTISDPFLEQEIVIQIPEASILMCHGTPVGFNTDSWTAQAQQLAYYLVGNMPHLRMTEKSLDSAY